MIIITKHKKKFCGSIEATTSWVSPFLSILTLPNHPLTPKSSGSSLSSQNFRTPNKPTHNSVTLQCLQKNNFVLCSSDPKAGKRGECLLIRQERTVLLVWDIWEQEEGGGGHCYIGIWLLSERKKNLGTNWTHWKQKGEGIRELGAGILEVLRELLGVRGRRKRRTTLRGIMVLCSC